jgi:hypothetical protein
MEENDEEIVSTGSDLYSTWEVQRNHRCVNIKNKTTGEIYQTVRGQLSENYPDLWSQLDYFNMSDGSDTCKPWPEHNWVAVFYVRGGSEGFYIHVAVLSSGKYRTMFLGKTLCEGQTGVRIAEGTANAIARIMEV